MTNDKKISPFPGMDPYLERHWRDVHTSLRVYARNQINAQLPGDLQARVEQSAALEIDEQVTRTIYPDVRVVEDPHGDAGGAAAGATAIAAEPLILVVEDDAPPQRHIEIVDATDGGRVVTVIEFLSPGNKTSERRRAIDRRKQRDCLEAGVNLVEIDLTREGAFILAAPEERIPPDYRTPYGICVRRAADACRVQFYRAPLRDPLPNIPIPLRPEDRDVILRLQPLIEACYRDGRYDRTNYSLDPVPPLPREEAEWADGLLRQTGRR